MGRPLRALVIEDNESDAELLEIALRRAGYEPVLDRVETAEDMRAALARETWDIVLSDYRLPCFTGVEALRILKERGIDVPFILVSGTLGEEQAVAVVKAGAHDYLLKGSLSRLGVAIDRELREAVARREHRAAQEALRRSEERYRTLAEAAHDGIFIFDRRGRVEYANVSGARRFGAEPEGVVGRSIDELFGSAAPRYRASLEQSLAKRAHVYFEEKTPFPTGETWLGVWLVALGGGTAPEGVLGVARDIGERIRAEEAVRASEERYRTLFHRNPAGIYRNAMDGRIVECNEAFARIYGFASREEALQARAMDLYPSPDARKAFLARLLAEGAVTDAESLGRRKDGRPVWVLETASVVLGPGGAPEFIEGAVVDVTDRKQLEEQLRQSQKMEAVGQLAGGVAHDFNNLLSVICGYCELILKRLSVNDPVGRKVLEIRKAGDRAAALTRHLLTFSRRQAVVAEVLDLNDVLAGMEGLLRRLIREDIQCMTILSPRPCRVSADPGQIEQVVMNLAVNAQDAMPEGGRLAIETSVTEVDPAHSREYVGLAPGRYAVLSVTDTGTGMDAETQARIFEPFFTTKEPGRGTGLGLATVYGIVHQNTGMIRVSSTPGQGSTFTVYLPAVEMEAKRWVAPVAADLPRGTETILLVEDEDAVRKLSLEMLEGLGYRVIDAPDGAAALALAHAYKGEVHLLMTDLVMPHLGGRPLAEALEKRRPGIKVLYTSGYAGDILLAVEGSAGTATFVQKPFTLDALARKIREALDLPATRREVSPAR
jgi:two-component system, cell cycle sensor histidine kinase and response regulator CckA